MISSDFGANVIRIDRPGDGESSDTLARGTLTHKRERERERGLRTYLCFTLYDRKEVDLFGFEERKTKGNLLTPC